MPIDFLNPWLLTFSVIIEQSLVIYCLCKITNYGNKFNWITFTFLLAFVYLLTRYLIDARYIFPMFDAFMLRGLFVFAFIFSYLKYNFDRYDEIKDYKHLLFFLSAFMIFYVGQLNYYIFSRLLSVAERDSINAIVFMPLYYIFYSILFLSSIWRIIR